MNSHVIDFLRPTDIYPRYFTQKDMLSCLLHSVNNTKKAGVSISQKKAYLITV
jgi:hypothetical protein